jgi:hypothetical protein
MQQIPANIYETQQDHQECLEAMQRREGAIQRGQNGVCYLCGEEHQVPEYPGR